MELQLKHGTCHIDDEDAGLVSRYSWWSNVASRKRSNVEHIYVYGRPMDAPLTVRVDGVLYRLAIVPLHRVLMGVAEDDPRHVDHINGNGLDNRRANLRMARSTQNVVNSGPRRRGLRTSVRPSGYKGVSFDKVSNRWKAQIMVDGKNHNLGRFVSPEEAARVYNAAAQEAWGEFAFLNETP